MTKLVNESLNEFMGSAPELPEVSFEQVVSKIEQARDWWENRSEEEFENWDTVTFQDDDLIQKKLIEKYPFINEENVWDFIEDIALAIDSTYQTTEWGPEDLKGHNDWVEEEHGIPEEIQLQVYDDYMDYILDVFERSKEKNQN